MKYVIKSERQMQYLFCLGFDYKTVTDRAGKNRFVYLFTDSPDLHKALEFYCNMHSKRF